MASSPICGRRSLSSPPFSWDRTRTWRRLRWVRPAVAHLLPRLTSSRRPITSSCVIAELEFPSSVTSLFNLKIKSYVIPKDLFFYYYYYLKECYRTLFIQWVKTSLFRDGKCVGEATIGCKVELWVGIMTCWLYSCSLCSLSEHDTAVTSPEFLTQRPGVFTPPHLSDALVEWTPHHNNPFLQGICTNKQTNKHDTVCTIDSLRTQTSKSLEISDKSPRPPN